MGSQKLGTGVGLIMLLFFGLFLIAFIAFLAISTPRIAAAETEAEKAERQGDYKRAADYRVIASLSLPGIVILLFVFLVLAPYIAAIANR